METHSSVLAWKIPWTEEPDGLLSMGSQRIDTTEFSFFFLMFDFVLFIYFLFLLFIK